MIVPQTHFYETSIRTIPHQSISQDCSARSVVESDVKSVTCGVSLYCNSVEINTREARFGGASAVERFLGGSRTVMLMSIDAGGTGLHLVPGSNAVVFWGSRPFSPMQVLQTAKRVHRIGQEHPVNIKHLIAAGSVDFAINMVHGDKLSVSKAIVDDDLSSLESQGGRWRSTGRIVDACRFLSEEGTFLDEDPAANPAAGYGTHGHRSSGAGSSSSPDALYGYDAPAASAPVINPGSVDDLMMDLPPLPPTYRTFKLVDDDLRSCVTPPENDSVDMLTSCTCRK